ncbi:hypothetical protein IEQ34_019042 [Dendrobium chrysotoxum]|uniref:Uncharacterized protein n=1 Tax=Dendrobium chrysotoxum TaxID=161865 RepID=A0AAV7G8V9_DENCH|nr:hypothetical protein IEQ34_019042 [Dendrobium chrysotoxum]
MTSLDLSLISTYPSGCTTPTSPVKNQPSLNTSEFASSLLKYPFITLLPLITISPTAFPSLGTLTIVPTSFTSTSLRLSTPIPCLALSLACSALVNRFHSSLHSQTSAGPVASVIPYACVTWNPNFSTLSSSAAGGGAPPVRTSTLDSVASTRRLKMTGAQHMWVTR